MSEQFEIFFSNRLEVLYQNFKENLFHPYTHPFTRRLVVVYGPAMKNWLLLQMAKDPNLGIAAGIEIIYLNDAFETLTRICEMGTQTYLPSQIELALAIEQQIIHVLKNFSLLSYAEQEDWMPILHYLKVDPKNFFRNQIFSRKAERRLVGLSKQIANCFRDYGRFAGPLVSEWENPNTPGQGWQQHLWKNLYGPKSEWTYPYKNYQNSLVVPKRNLEVYFFSISFINQSEFHFLQELSQHIPVYYSLLSPCAVFWSDIRSDKESAYLQKYWQKKLGYDSSNVAQLEELLRDRNPLLANFGRLGREMACRIEESGIQTHAHYQLPDSVAQLEDELFINDDLELIESKHPLTLLHAIQADILLMRNPQGKSKVSIEGSDRSIQLHITHTKRREIEILYHNILGLIEKNNALCPSDIIVMAPQIMDYVPYIQSLFGAQDSILDFQILDVGVQSQGEMMQGFRQLLALSESRWDSTTLLQLFENRAFLRKQHLTTNDYTLIQRWIETTGIRWGENPQHRNELLESQHCQQGMADETSIGTWSYGIDRLLMGLTTYLKPNHSASTDIQPYEYIDFSQAELLGKWIRIFNSLRDDLTLLHERNYLTIEEWVNYLHCLLESYFQHEYNDSQSKEEYLYLKSQFEILRSSSRSLKEDKFSFISIKSHLETLFQQNKTIYRENHVQTVRFCSMMPLRSIPAQVIALIGMQEGAFPRQGEKFALNIASQKELSDYCPTPIDYDRYLFLEALHSAQEHLIISYQGYNQQDGKQMQPALVVEELISYLDKNYSINGKKISQICIHKHPFNSFDEIYFQSDTPFVSYSINNFKTALLHYADNKNPTYSYVKEFNLIEHPQPEIIPHNSVIDVKLLTAITKNPIKFHLNKVLDIYLETHENRSLKNEEDLVLSSLDKYFLKQSGLNEPSNILLSRAEREGKMPFGLFKEVATKKFNDDIEDIKERLQKYDLLPQDLYKIEFSTGCQEPTQKDPYTWTYPALTLTYPDGYQFQIVGELANVSSKGLVAFTSNTLAEAWKMWPQFLLFLHATQLNPAGLEKNLLLIKNSEPKIAFFDNPEQYFKSLIGYYCLCLKNFSPLLPEWIPLILANDVSGLAKKMEQLFSEQGFGSEYQGLDVRWILNKDKLPDAEKIIQIWKPQAQSLLGEIVNNWYPRKAGKSEGCEARSDS